MLNRVLFFTLCVLASICLVFLSTFGLFAQACPDTGLDKNGNLPQQRFVDLNKLKNRKGLTQGAAIKNIKLGTVLAAANNNKFSNDDPASITGYVVSIYWGGPEDCNCFVPKVKDVHVAIVCDPKYELDKTKWMLLEVPPRFQQSVGDVKSLTSQHLYGRWVTFTGMMFYDKQHEPNARTTNPTGKPSRVKGGVVWRETPWELHPLTGFQVLTKKPAGNLCTK